MLSTITVRSLLAGSRSTRIETAGLRACMVAQAPRKNAIMGTSNALIDPDPLSRTYRSFYGNTLLGWESACFHRFTFEDSKRALRCRQAFGSAHDRKRLAD